MTWLKRLARNEGARLFAVCLASVLISAAATTLLEEVRNRIGPDARVVAARDAGVAYGRVLAATYSDAWDKAADRLEAGSTLPAALAEVRPAWEAARTPQFESIVRPAFAAIVPDSTPEEAIKPEDRKAMIAAFRAFARGLDPP